MKKKGIRTFVKSMSARDYGMAFRIVVLLLIMFFAIFKVIWISVAIIIVAIVVAFVLSMIHLFSKKRRKE